MSGISMRAPGPPGEGALTFAVLGPLEVRQGTAVLDLPGPRERALLALLLTAPGRVFSVPAIVAGIWGDEAPRQAEKTVQSYVSRLRRSLPDNGTPVVVTRSPGYVAAVDPDHVDAERFRALAANGQRDLAAGRPKAAAAQLQEALGLWRGEAYAEFDAPFATTERAALEELRLAAVENRIAADLALGAGLELVGELETLVTRHSWRERLWAQLMTALYRSGRQADALAAFQRARACLVDELGIEPGPELRAVEASVLAQDARLLAPSGSVEPLPPALPLAGPTFVGREAELAQLLEVYARAADPPSVERVLLIGPHGIGKTRLLAELAREAQARGALVRYGTNDAWPQAGGTPVVILLDDLQRAQSGDLAALAERVVAARPPMLVVGACVMDDNAAEPPAALSRVFTERLPVPPLQRPEIAEIVALYVPAGAVDDGVAAVADAAGVPLHVHAAASRFGEQLAAAQVEEAAAGIAKPRRHLTESQARVTEGVLDLQRIRLVREAHATAETPRVVCPYKGLACFDSDDAPYFFGRQRLVAQLVARLVDARVLAVVGASGSGKSSAVRAGLIPALRAGMLPGSQRWHTMLTMPTRPSPELPATDGTRTVLVVDQFEELFTALSPAQQTGYATWLADAADRPDVTVIVVVRSDYYAQAAAHPGVRDLLVANTVLVGEMTLDELKQAVESPAIAGGLELEAGLPDKIADDVAGEPGGLPLMSTALLSLWEQRDGRRLTGAAYHAIGGVRTAVARLAETAYGQLTPPQQSVARRTLLRLAEIGEAGEPVRRRVPIADVAPDGDRDARAVLDTLAARRLLTVSETHAEVAHEALLREWPRVRGWLDEDEAGRRLRRHLAPAARDWRAGGRDTSELYRGPRLAAALDWQRDHPDDLTNVEHDFLRASRDAAEGEAQRRRRSIRRLRGLAAGLAAVLVLAVVASLVAVDHRNDATRASLAADVRALQTTALSENRWDRALLYAAQAQRFEPSQESRAALLQTIQRGPEATAIYSADKPLHSLAVSPDGTRLAASGINGTVYIWDTDTGQRVESIRDVTGFMAATLDISSDGRYVAAVGVPIPLYDEKNYTFQVVVVDLEQTPPSVRFLKSDDVHAARFAADGRTIVTLNADGRVHYVDVQTGAVQRTLDLNADESFDGYLNGPENRRFMAAFDPELGRVWVWDVDTGHELWSSSDEPGVAAATVSPDGTRLIVGYDDGRIEQVGLDDDGARTPVTSFLTNGLVELAWSPDGSTFAGVTQERTVLVWDADTREVKDVLRGHWGNLSQAVYSPDGATIYAAGFDRSVVAWDLTGTKGIVTDVGQRPAPDVQTAGLAADGSVLAVAYPDDRVEVFDTATGETFQVTVPGSPDGWVLNVDRAGRSVLVHVVVDATFREGGGPLPVHTIDVPRGELLPYTIELDVLTAWDAVVTWDNESILTAGQRRVGLYDLDTGEPLDTELFDAAGDVVAIGVHPGGRLAALSEELGSIEIIDLTSGQLIETLNPGDELRERLGFLQVAFSPDGRWLAAASNSGQVVIWDTGSWRPHSTHDAVAGFALGSIAFTPDSKSLIVGGAGTASIWSVEQPASAGVRLDVDPLQPEADVRVGTRDGGRTVVTFSEGTGVREWTIAPERLLEHACTVAGRNLTQEEWNEVLPHRPYERTCPQYSTG